MKIMSNISRADFFAQPWEVWVIAPWLETDDETLQYYYDYSQSVEEFTKAFTSLKLPWTWKSVSPQNVSDVLTQIKSESSKKQPIVFNLCDGDGINGVPGMDVIQHLKSSGIIFTGAREEFYDVTTCKIRMKNAFEAQGVSTAPWKVINEVANGEIWSSLKHLALPLIVKPAVSAGSMGLSIKSVVETPEDLAAQLSILKNGCHGWNTAQGGIYVEQFIKGREFTTLIVGNADRPHDATIYLPVERVFDGSLPEHERFLSFDRLWEFYEAEKPLPMQAALYQYEPVDAELSEAIKALSWKAYAAVQGSGYGRIDLRMDDSRNLQVLEVNAQCGLSEDENFTSVGAILRFENKCFADLVVEILMDAVRQLPFDQLR